jgi:hypothetical protein
MLPTRIASLAILLTVPEHDQLYRSKKGPLIFVWLEIFIEKTVLSFAVVHAAMVVRLNSRIRLWAACLAREKLIV